jgi:hypothetical protein
MKYRRNFTRNSALKFLWRIAGIASTARYELAEREGFELGEGLKGISKLLKRKAD